MATSVTQYGIEITFDDDYTVGQYVNGDYYVVAPSGLNVTGITVGTGDHAAGSVEGRDGAMINPVPRSSNDPLGMQGYDSRGLGYLASLNKTTSYPFALAAGESLVVGESTTVDRSYSGGSNKIWIETTMILTCVASAPAANSFRPQYCSGTKTTHNISEISWTDPELAAPASVPSLATVESWITRPHIDHGIGWVMRVLHPYQNMHDYGREICEDYGNALLMAMLDPADVGDKTTLIQRLIQVGIDLYGIAQAGGYWPSDGGHGMGRKAPILFAGKLLNVSGMINIGTSNRFQEDDQTFYISQADVDRALNCKITGDVVSAADESVTIDVPTPDWADGNTIEITAGTGAEQTRIVGTTSSPYTTLPITVAWDTNPDATSDYQIHGYLAGQIGDAEWGLRHKTDPTKDNPSPRANYRSLNGPYWYAHALAVLILDIQDEWAWPAYFDYLALYDNPRSGFFEEMYDAHWDTYYAAPAGPVPSLSVRTVLRG